MTDMIENMREKIILEYEEEVKRARRELDGIVGRANGRIKWEPQNRREIDRLVAEANNTYRWAVLRAEDRKEARLQALALQVGEHDMPSESNSMKF